MSTEFALTERVIGFAADAAETGGTVRVVCAESLTSLDGVHLTWRLEELHNAVFSRIPDLPDPSHIKSLLVVIQPDLSATAYINEIKPVAGIRPARPIVAGEQVLVADVLDVTTFEIGVPIPDECGVIVVFSQGWRRSLFYDLCPLDPGSGPRKGNISSALAKQMLALVRGKFAEVIEQKSMKSAIEELERLIADRVNDESKYQEFLMRRPWLLGGLHTDIERHTNLDERSIPDFTGIRASDGFRDIFEIKPPFMKCFRKDDGFTAEFNDAWSQAERYLNFTREQRQYLRDKGLRFENPRCYLLAGHNLNEEQLRALRVKEAFNPAITVLTYEQVLAVAKGFLAKLEAAAAV